MYYDNPFSIPQELLHGYPDQINLLVGENGSGKSSLLDQLSSRMVHFTNKKVIAIANTIHDKFRTRHRRFEALKANHGKSIVKRTLKSALQMLIESREYRFGQVAETLNYVNFDSVIGVKIIGLKGDFETRLKYNDISDKQQIALISLLQRYQDGIRRRSRDEIFRIDLHRGTFYELQDSGVLEILSFEKQLRKFNLIYDIEVYLQKNGRMISSHQGSSGELTLITTFIYLMTTMEYGTMLFIDEPENSLHPKWQVEYIKKLYDLVYRYEPTIYIATHSPLILNSAELELGQKVKVFKGTDGSFLHIEEKVNNVEEIYQSLFDITTPENRFLSKYVVMKLNQLTDKIMTIETFRNTIEDLKNSSYDERQINVLDGVLEMGERIARRIN